MHTGAHRRLLRRRFRKWQETSRATIAELGPDLIEFGQDSGENRGVRQRYYSVNVAIVAKPQETIL